MAVNPFFTGVEGMASSIIQSVVIELVVLGLLGAAAVVAGIIIVVKGRKHRR